MLVYLEPHKFAPHCHFLNTVLQITSYIFQVTVFPSDFQTNIAFTEVQLADIRATLIAHL
jgi:hypothetical protein